MQKLIDNRHKYTDCGDFNDYIETFSEYCGKIHGIDFKTEKGGIELVKDDTLESGAYRIECEENAVTAYAGDKDGASYAMATLLQI